MAKSSYHYQLFTALVAALLLASAPVAQAQISLEQAYEPAEVQQAQPLVTDEATTGDMLGEGTMPEPPETTQAMEEEAEPELVRTFDPKPVAKLRALDKITARTQSFDVRVGETSRFGDIFVKVNTCRSPSPIFTPESAAFVQVWEVPAGQNKSEWVFSGWMFASSPALSAMDHPVYDVWVLSCTDPSEKVEKATPSPSAADLAPDMNNPEEIPLD